MSIDTDDFIAREAVQRGWVSEARIEAAREAGRADREAGRPPRALAAILAERGDISLEQFNALVALARLQTAPSPPPDSSSAQYKFSPSVAAELAAAKAHEVTRPGPTIARDGTRRTERPDENIRRFGRYEIVSELGRGGMGVVYSARDPHLNRTVALKVMTGAPDSEESSRFQREATSMARLRHPNIVPVFDVGSEDQRPYYTMEMVEGESLAVVLRRMRVLPLRAALKITRDVAEALAEAHRNGLVHRDVKPGNILIAHAPMIGVGGSKDSGEMPAAAGETSLVLGRGTVASYRVLLSDFGLVRDLDSARLTKTGDIMGTPLYMSPEQARGETRAIGPLSDVYALGAVLYEMLAGRPPFTEPELARLLAMIENDDPPSLRTLAPGTPRDVETIVHKAMAKDPGRRYVSAAEFAEDIGRFLRGEAISARPSSFGYRFAKRVARHKAASAAIAVVAVALAVVGWMTYGPGWVDLQIEEGARIAVNGEDRGEVRTLRLWPPGRYRVEASMEHRLPVVLDVDVVAAKRIPLKVDLVSDRGTLLTHITPSAATLKITLAGAAVEPERPDPNRSHLLRLKVGTYRVRVEAPDYLPVETAFDIKSDQEVDLTPISLQHDFGFLTAEANVDGVTVLVFKTRSEDDFRQAIARRESPVSGASPVLWQFSNRVFGPAGALPAPQPPGPSPKASPPRVTPRTSALRPVWDWQVPLAPVEGAEPAAAAPDYRLSLPIERFPLDTGTYRLVYLKRNNTCREQFVRIESAFDATRGTSLRGAESSESLQTEAAAYGESLKASGVKCTLVSPARRGGFDCEDAEGRRWTSFPDRPGHTRCSVTLNDRERWSFRTEGAVSASPALADLNADGFLDVVVGSHDSRVSVLSGEDGRPLWQFSAGAPIYSSARLADLDLDGSPDVVVASRDGVIRALSGRDGAVLWEARIGTAVRSSAALADLDGDQIPDVVQTAILATVKDPGHTLVDTVLVALSGKDGRGLWRATVGKTLDRTPEQLDLDNQRVVESSPVLADLDADGVPDVAVGGRDGNVYAFSGKSGLPLWNHTTGADVQSSPAAGDLDGDEISDIAVASWDCKVYALSGRDGREIWSFDTGSAVTSSPALRDVDGDGTRDVLFGAFNAGVYALSGKTGQPIWRTRVGSSVHSSPAIGDLDRDGSPDLLIGADDGRAYALSGRDGRLLWIFATGGPVVSAPAVGDIDADGSLDAIVGSDDGKVYVVISADRPLLWEFKAEFGVWCSPGVADLNSDGVPDCILGSDDWKVYALSGTDGRPLWIFKTRDSVRAAPALADLNADGTPDCLIGSWDAGLYALSGRDGSPLWERKDSGRLEGCPAVAEVDGDGTPDCIVGSNDSRVFALSGKGGDLLWEHRTGDRVCATPALADLDGDGRLEVIAGSWDTKVYTLSSGKGQSLREFKTGDRVWSSPAVGDVDGDGRLDCAVTSWDSHLYALSGKDGGVLWKYGAGSILISSPALADFNGDRRLDAAFGGWDSKIHAVSGADGKALWTFTARASVAASPAIADLDRDGTPDVIVGSSDARLYALSGKTGALLWDFRTGQRVDSTPALADLDGDGAPECVFGSSDSRIYALRIGGAAGGRSPEAPPGTEPALLLRARQEADREAWRAVEAHASAALRAFVSTPLSGDGDAIGRAAAAGVEAHQGRAHSGASLGLRGAARLRLGRCGEAAIDLREASGRLPRSAEIWFDLAMATEARDEAVQSMAAAFVADAPHAWSRSAGKEQPFSRPSGESGEDPMAELVLTAEAHMAGFTASGERRSLLARALALMRGKRSGDALPLLDALVTADPRDIQALRFRGRARLDRGDPEGALADWRATLKLEGRFPEREGWIAEAERAAKGPGPAPK